MTSTHQDFVLPVFFAFILLIGLLMFAFWIWAIVSCINNPALDGTQRIIWILVLIFLHALGALIYFLAAPRRRPS